MNKRKKEEEQEEEKVQIEERQKKIIETEEKLKRTKENIRKIQKTIFILKKTQEKSKRKEKKTQEKSERKEKSKEKSERKEKYSPQEKQYRPLLSPLKQEFKKKRDTSINILKREEEEEEKRRERNDFSYYRGRGGQKSRIRRNQIVVIKMNRELKSIDLLLFLLLCKKESSRQLSCLKEITDKEQQKELEKKIGLGRLCPSLFKNLILFPLFSEITEETLKQKYIHDYVCKSTYFSVGTNINDIWYRNRFCIYFSITRIILYQLNKEIKECQNKSEYSTEILQWKGEKRGEKEEKELKNKKKIFSYYISALF